MLFRSGRLERHSPALSTRVLLALFSVLPVVVLFTAITSRHSPWTISLVSGLAVATWSTVLTWRRRWDEGEANPASGPLVIRERARESDGESSLKTERRAPVVATAQQMVDDARIMKADPPAGAADLSAGERREASSADRAAAEWTERTTDAAGQLIVRGQLSANFEAGQTHATAHIPFWPPFAGAPEFSCEVVDQASVRARPAVFHYGARLELRRAGDVATPLEVSIRFRAAAPSRANRAA